MTNIKRKNIFRIILIVIVAVFVFMFFLAACAPMIELNKRGLVQSIGIDYQKDTFTMSFQVFNLSSSSGGKEGGETKSDSLTIKSDGVTIIDAIKKAYLQQDKDLYYRVTSVIILGKNILLNEQVFRQTIDVLNQLYIANPNIYMVMSDKKASDIIETKLKQSNMASNFIENMLQNSEEHSYVKNIYLKDAINSLNDINKSIPIPIIGKQKKEGEDNEELRIKGIGVINSGKLKGEISTDEMKYLTFLDNKKSQLTFDFCSKKYGRYNCDVLKRHVDIKPSIVDDKPHFNINLNIDNILYENNKNYNIQNLSSKDIAELERTQKEYLEYNILKLLNKLLKKYKVDLYYFTNDIYRYYYDYWLKNKDNWEEMLSEITISINVNPHIVRLIV